MGETTEAPVQPELTWGKVWKWVGILYGASLFGFFVKASSQTGGLLFKNVVLVFGVALQPAIQMFWFAVIILVYLATKKFDVSKAQGFMSTMAWIYIIYVAFRLFSGLLI